MDTSMFTGLFDKDGAFDRMIGYGLEYQRIQHGIDASGQSQETITKVPQKDSQAIPKNSTLATPTQGGISKEMKYGIGALMAVGVLVLVARR
ncbi:hypothetical protein [Vibrio sp. SCSIO 43137]|uniref:hypothetical protein n=1 Tax=Vibrio sp. SCSIO 43137 TaxID=3021011 RepID=UPI002307F706|nr:hypothetical protein [Vibrio sp. SCSIO 43137]WCE31108.1 hypothetical protein PK654_07540 [Vibrio sp. SCSIO 43137]